MLLVCCHISETVLLCFYVSEAVCAVSMLRHFGDCCYAPTFRRLSVLLVCCDISEILLLCSDVSETLCW